MKPLYARALTEAEQTTLRHNLKSADGLTVRRTQMILMSAEEGLKVDEIGRRLGCHGQTVRETLHAFQAEGLKALKPKSKGRPDDQRAFDDEARIHLRELVRQSPRAVGYEASLWTLELLAQASHEHGLTRQPVSGETVRATLVAMGIRWKRAKHWITSPDPDYERKKSDGIG
jgi:transposase